MKKIITMALASTAILTSSFADTIVFGDDTAGVGWKGQGVADNASSSQTATIIADGITFTLSITGSANINTTSGDGTAFGITGGDTDQSDNVRISTSTNSLPAEWVELSLSVSGATENLTELSLESVFTRYLAAGETLDASDGTTTVQVDGGTTAEQYLDYSDQLSGLNALSVANVGGLGDGSWSLRLTATADGTDAFSNFSLDDLTVNYTVPEPATITLIVGLGGSILFVRRRFM